MFTSTNIVKEVVLMPGSYHISELIYGLEFIVLDQGPQRGATFPIWDTYDTTIDNTGKVPLTLTYTETRSWRTAWRKKLVITAHDGANVVTLTEQAPNTVPVVIRQELSVRADVRRP